MFKDHFSGHASEYAAHRPTYPPALFAHLASLTAGHDLAWDSGTGNGQAAVDLAAHFTRVVATDPSDAQISNAAPHGRVKYVIAKSEESPLETSSADIVTAAQALHWFDAEQFFLEVKRVVRPSGVLAVWSYGTFFHDETDELIDRFHRRVEAYWPPERSMVEDGYQALSFPFDEIPAPKFEMSMLWSANQTLDYLRTWSAVRRFMKANDSDPVEEIASDLRRQWSGNRRVVKWPLHLRTFRVG